MKHNVVLVCVGDATTPHATRLQLEGILDASPGTSVILLGSNDTPAEIVALLEAGARGYISTALQLSVAAEAIALVAEGGVFAPASSLLASIAAHTKRETNGRNSSPGLFTARQEAVLRCLASAKPNKRIAYDLNMCESTVKVHVRTIMKKLRAHNRTEVAVIARDLLASGSAIAKR